MRRLSERRVSSASRSQSPLPLFLNNTQTNPVPSNSLVHEIATAGPNFKAASNFLWPFKLSSPTGGWRARKFTGYVEGGDEGLRENAINALIKQMN